MTSSEPASPADPTSYRRRGFGFGFWLAMAFALVCVAAGALIVYGPRLLRFPQSTDAVQPVPPQASEPPVAASATALATPPTTSVSAEPQPGDLSGVIARLERLETNQTRTLEAASAALAAANLMEAAQSARPFAGELAAVEPFLPPSDTAPLRSLARTGAPTRPVLASDFAAAASRAIAAANQPADDAGLMDRVGYALSSVVTIRRVDYTRGDGVNAVLARAELLAHDGDIEGALIELEKLPPGARQAMGGWIERAQRRVAIDSSLTGVRAASIRSLNAALAGM